MADEHEIFLRSAAQKGDLETLVYYVRLGTDVNSTDRNQATALHFASFEGHDLLVNSLIQAGAEVDAVNRNGQASLHLAASKGHADVVARLIKADCDPFIKTKYSGMTALHLATQNGHRDVIIILLSDERVDADILDLSGRKAEDYAKPDKIKLIFAKHQRKLSAKHRKEKEQQLREEIDRNKRLERLDKRSLTTLFHLPDLSDVPDSETDLADRLRREHQREHTIMLSDKLPIAVPIANGDLKSMMGQKRKITDAELYNIRRRSSLAMVVKWNDMKKEQKKAKTNSDISEVDHKKVAIDRPDLLVTKPDGKFAFIERTKTMIMGIENAIEDDKKLMLSTSTLEAEQVDVKIDNGTLITTVDSTVKAKNLLNVGNTKKLVKGGPETKKILTGNLIKKNVEPKKLAQNNVAKDNAKTQEGVKDAQSRNIIANNVIENTKTKTAVKDNVQSKKVTILSPKRESQKAIVKDNKDSTKAVNNNLKKMLNTKTESNGIITNKSETKTVVEERTEVNNVIDNNSLPKTVATDISENPPITTNNVETKKLTNLQRQKLSNKLEPKTAIIDTDNDEIPPNKIPPKPEIITPSTKVTSLLESILKTGKNKPENRPTTDGSNSTKISESEFTPINKKISTSTPKTSIASSNSEGTTISNDTLGYRFNASTTINDEDDDVVDFGKINIRSESLKRQPISSNRDDLPESDKKLNFDRHKINFSKRERMNMWKQASRRVSVNVHHELVFSDEHVQRMKLNVFDRLSQGHSKYSRNGGDEAKK